MSESLPILLTDRTVIRQLTIRDSHDIFQIRSDISVNKYLDRPIAVEEKDAEDFIINISEKLINKNVYYWGITYRGSETVIGTICIWNFSEDRSNAEIGFELLPSFQGKGIMKEVIIKIIQYTFENTGLLSLDAYTSPQNKRSIQLLISSRFKFIKEVNNEMIFRLAKIDGQTLHLFE